MLLTWWRKLTDSRSQGANHRQCGPALRKPFRGLQLERLEDRLAPASHTWTGDGATPFWSDSANWAGGTPAGDANALLIFPDGAAQQGNENDLPGLTIKSITFFGAFDYSLTGDAVTLSSGILLVSNTTDIASATITFDITLNGPQTFIVSSSLNGGATLDIRGGITGDSVGQLTKAGNAQLVLEGSNSYAGGTAITDGVLAVSGDSPLGTGVLDLAGGSLLSLDTTARINNAFRVSGYPGKIVNSGSDLTFTGPGTLLAGENVDAVAKLGSSITFNGILSGKGGVLTEGFGNYVLARANNYMGSTRIDGGTLSLGADNAIPSDSEVAISSDATLNLTQFDDSIGGLNGEGFVDLGSGILTIGNNGSDYDYEGDITGTGALIIKAGHGLQELRGNNSYTGGTTLVSGILAVAGFAPLGGTPLGTGTVALNGGTIFSLRSFLVLTNPLVVGGVVSVGIGDDRDDGVIIFRDMTITAGSSLSVGSAGPTFFAGDISGSGAINIYSTLVIVRANTYTGATTIDGGSLLVDKNGALGTGTLTIKDGLVAGRGDSGNPVMLANPFTVVGMSDVSGIVFTGPCLLTRGSELMVGTDTSTTLGGGIDGPGSLHKIDSGKLILGNRNTYQGPTVVDQGTLQLTSDDALPPSSKVTVAAGATLDFNKGQNDLMPGSSITGTGSVSFSGGTANIAGTYDLTGGSSGTQVTGGTVNFLSPVTGLGNTLMINSGIANFGTNAALAIPNLALSGGTLNGGSITVTTGMVWTGGHVDGSGAINIEGVSPLAIDGKDPKYLDSRTLNIRPGGIVIWGGTGGIWIKDHSSVNNAGTFNTTTTGGNHFVFNGDPGDAPEVNNTGVFQSDGSVMVDPGVTFTNTGAVLIRSGTLNIGDDYTQNGGTTAIASGAVLKTGGTVKNNGGILSGSGVVDGSVINAGQINPGDAKAETRGILTINGDYTQTATGVLNIRIGGFPPDSVGYDQLLIAGQANLDGTVNVTLFNNFVPPSGRTIQILVFNSLSGVFATTNIDPSFMPLIYNPRDITLQAI